MIYLKLNSNRRDPLNDQSAVKTKEVALHYDITKRQARTLVTSEGRTMREEAAVRAQSPGQAHGGCEEQLKRHDADDNGDHRFVLPPPRVGSGWSGGCWLLDSSLLVWSGSPFA